MKNVINILKAFCMDGMIFGAFVSTQMKQAVLSESILKSIGTILDFIGNKSYINVLNLHNFHYYIF